MSVNGNGGNYAPLKQIQTDSESEDEQKLDNEINDVRIKPADSCNNLDLNSGLQSSKNFSMSDTDDFNTNMNTLESTMDNVSFLQSDASNKMSFPRRCVFIASILMCVFTVVIFLWGIPCSDTGSCANSEWVDKTTSWELPYDEIELSGAVQVVDGAVPNTKNLIFIYRGNHMKHQGSNDNVNGVLLIVGNSGKVGWYTRETRIPTEINCNMIDVNRDKQRDCIVSGSEGLLAALNPLSGTYYWYIHKEGKVFGNIAAIDFPVVLKDMNTDKVNDLLTVATVYPNTNHNSLIVISGMNGNIIGEPITIEDCRSVKLLKESAIINITYNCRNGTSEAIRSISYSILYRKLSKIDKSPNHLTSAPFTSKKVNLSLKKNIGNTREIYANGPGKLIVENSGECPNSCRVTLKLQLERNGTTNVTWEYAANHVYAMRPSSFAFANAIRGFVLKL